MLNSYEQGYNDSILRTIGNVHAGTWLNTYQGETLNEDSLYFNSEDYYKGRVEGLTKVIGFLLQNFKTIQKTIKEGE